MKKFFSFIGTHYCMIFSLVFIAIAIAEVFVGIDNAFTVVIAMLWMVLWELDAFKKRLTSVTHDAAAIVLQQVIVEVTKAAIKEEEDASGQ